MSSAFTVKGLCWSALFLACAALPISGVAQTSPPSPKPWTELTTSELIAQAPADAWQALDPAQTLYMDFEPTPGSRPVRVVLALAPDLAPSHVSAVKALVAAKFFDNRAIVRSQDNYVVQWGDGAAAAALNLPGAKMAPEFDTHMGRDFRPTRLRDGDVYAKRVGLWRNWPVAWDPATRRAWLPHCYGMVGAGRDEAPDSGGPAEMYVVNGHSPRALDRNVTLFGRVVRGMEHLTTLPRGTEALGFYSDAQIKPKLVAIRLASDLPVDQREAIQVLRTDHPIYAHILESRRNRRDSWTLWKAGKLEICNAPLPVRVAP
jgi:peptidylprolyl isomerase